MILSYTKMSDDATVLHFSYILYENSFYFDPLWWLINETFQVMQNEIWHT